MWSKILLLSAALLLSASHANAQKVYAIIIGDTNDETIAFGIAANLKMLGIFFEEAKTKAELNITVVEVKGDQFDCNSILDAVKQVKSTLTANDAVIFHYSGHGYRSDPVRDRARTNPERDKFPLFDCKRSSDSTPTGLVDVVDKLIADVPPRFVLAVADTCNKTYRPGQQMYMHSYMAPQEANRKAGIRRLFLDYRGTLIMAGCGPNEFCYYQTIGSKAGGHFTKQLMKTIDARINQPVATVRWSDITIDATKPIVTSDADQPLQSPIFSGVPILVAATAQPRPPQLPPRPPQPTPRP